MFYSAAITFKHVSFPAGSYGKPWRAIPTQVMQICCHGNVRSVSRSFPPNSWHLLYLNQQDIPTSSLQDILPLSLSLFLSFSFPSFFPLALPLFLLLSLCLSLSLSLPFSLSPSVFSAQTREKLQEADQAMRKAQNASGLKRCSSIPGAIPQISRSRQTPRLGEYGREHPNSCGKSRAAACARKCVLQAKWWASPTSLFSSRCSPAAAKLEWAISVVKGFGNGWALWGGSAMHCTLPSW